MRTDIPEQKGGLGHTKTMFSAQRGFICPRGQSPWNMRQGQDIEDEGEEHGKKGGWEGEFAWEGQRTASGWGGQMWPQGK